MDREISGAQTVEALFRISDLLRETYERDPKEFNLDPEEHARLDYTLSHVDYVRTSPPSEDNAQAVEQLKPHLVWLWGTVLSHSIPIRRALPDAKYDKILGELAWVEGLVEGRGMEDQPVTQCGNCGRAIPGQGFALCASCQVAGYRECKNCEKRVASTTNPYCDVCAEEILGTG